MKSKILKLFQSEEHTFSLGLPNFAAIVFVLPSAQVSVLRNTFSEGVQQKLRHHIQQIEEKGYQVTELQLTPQISNEYIAIVDYFGHEGR